MWEFVDKVIYINLDEREDRREIMAKFFEEGQIPSDKIVRFPAIKHIAGSIGCSMSHMAVIQLAKDNNWNRVLVLEDDVTWNDFEFNYKKLCDAIETPNWDACMLGGIYMDIIPPYKLNYGISSYSYIVQRHYYDTLLANEKEGLAKLIKSGKRLIWNPCFNKDTLQSRINPLYYATDTYWFRLQLRDSWIGIDTHLCKHINTYSNITNTISLLYDVNAAKKEFDAIIEKFKKNEIP